MTVRFTRLTRPATRTLAPGQRIHRTLGLESEGVTRERAETFIEAARTRAREDRLNLPKGRKVVLGFRDAAKRCLERLEQEGGRDIKYKRMRLGKHLVPFFRDVPLDKLASFDLERYKKARQGEGVSPGTINRELAALSHLFNKAVDWKWISHRPCRIVRLGENRGRITYLTVEQALRLLDAARADRCEHIFPFVLVALETSMRKSEVLSIRLEHIDLERRIIYVPKAKAGAREQPITARLVEFLRGYMEATKPPEQAWLFPSASSRSGHVEWIEEPFRRIVEEAGLKPGDVVPHTLRHTAITHLVQAGVDLPTVQRISGHRTLQMVVRYSHQNGEHIQAAMDKLERRYEVAQSTPLAGAITPELHQAVEETATAAPAKVARRRHGTAMPRAGLEPARVSPHWILSPACLPISPPRRAGPALHW